MEESEIRYKVKYYKGTVIKPPHRAIYLFATFPKDLNLSQVFDELKKTQKYGNVLVKVHTIDELERPDGKRILDRELYDIIEDLTGSSQKLSSCIGLMTDWRCDENDLEGWQKETLKNTLRRCKCIEDDPVLKGIWLTNDQELCYYCEDQQK